jgi:uncharacterized glyoxalase superfamily protein PhnB
MWHAITPRIVTHDPDGLVAFLREVFGAEVDARSGGPSVVTIGDSRLMISGPEAREPFAAFLYVYVDDVDATFRRAVAAGVTVIEEVWDTPYGDRRGMFEDGWGNVWQVARITSPRPLPSASPPGSAR